MGLTTWVGRASTTRARVLIVEVPGWALTRVTVEQAVGARGWRPALSPADADVLMVCGQPGEAFQAVIERLWQQVPGPGVQVAADHPDQVVPALQRATTVLQHGEQDRNQGPGGSTRTDPGTGQDQHRSTGQQGDGHLARDGDAGDTGDGGTDMPDREQHQDMDGDMDMDGMDMDGMDMDGMDMPMPGGIPLAGGDEDRDGLEMDVLSVPLGPVLPAWPAGLVLRCVLHGDVIAAARTQLLPGLNDEVIPLASGDGHVRAAWDCDAVARLLELAGRPVESAGFRRIRDFLLAGAAPGDTVGELSRRVRRSRLLRWSLRGLGRIDDSELTERGLPAGLAGDVHDRLLTRLGGIGDVLRHGGPGADDGDDADAGARALAVVDLLPDLVVGLDVGTARLVVASLAPDVAAAGRSGSTGG